MDGWTNEWSMSKELPPSSVSIPVACERRSSWCETTYSKQQRLVDNWQQKQELWKLYTPVAPVQSLGKEGGNVTGLHSHRIPLNVGSYKCLEAGKTKDRLPIEWEIENWAPTCEWISLSNMLMPSDSFARCCDIAWLCMIRVAYAFASKSSSTNRWNVSANRITPFTDLPNDVFIVAGIQQSHFLQGNDYFINHWYWYKQITAHHYSKSH